MSQSSATIGITLGDPAGVGPEIICKSLAGMTAHERKATLVVGNVGLLGRAAKVTGTNLKFRAGRPQDMGPDEVAVNDIALTGEIIASGKLDPRAGDAAFRFIARAVELAQSGEIGCIVTAPINKESLNGAGHHYDGHTGMLAALTGAKASFMLLASEKLSVIHVSTHLSLKTAIDRVTTARVLETVRAGNEHLKRLGIAKPRIAVAGLNPHCGEHGLFGTEDEEQLVPAVAAARAAGINANGPISPDTVYFRAYSGEFDLVVAQYHDQGHIPMKLVAFDSTVNVSLGLPIDRTSVDHGTAFDIAGTGKANHINLDAAIVYARQLANAPRLKPEAQS